MAGIKAVIFDLDDTLYPERAFVFSGYRAVAEVFRDRLGDPAETVTLLERVFHSDHRCRAFDALLERRDLNADQDMVQGMIDVYRKHQPTISLHDDADAALTRFRSHHKLGIVSDGPVGVQRAKVVALGIETRVDVIILTDELGAGFGKPHPRAFELIAEQLAVDATASVYIADNAAKDFIAPNALGWRTIRIVRPDGVYRDSTAPDGGSPQHVVHSLDQIDNLFT